MIARDANVDLASRGGVRDEEEHGCLVVGLVKCPSVQRPAMVVVPHDDNRRYALSAAVRVWGKSVPPHAFEVDRCSWVP